MVNSGFVITPGGPTAVVREVFDEVNRYGALPGYVDLYAEKGEIERSRFTSEVRDAMVQWLLGRGVKVADAHAFEDGQYDELFALAYNDAVERAGGRRDPIDAARIRGTSTSWDFEVDTFDDMLAQGVIPENIRAAGAVDYVFELGEAMGVFALADALVLNWAAGTIDVVDGEAANALFRYHKLREERSTREERAMLYRRVLGKGGGRVLDRMAANDGFPTLWANLMREAALYIEKTERLDEGRTPTSPVSRAGLYQATRDLQYNLTEYCTGMAHLQVAELYAQLQEAFDLLRHPEIVAHFGGSRRKTMWSVIERLAIAETGSAPNIGALRTSAVDGNVIFRWVAGFDDGTVVWDDFDRFLASAEAYIHARAALAEDATDVFADEAANGADEDAFEDDFFGDDF